MFKKVSLYSLFAFFLLSGCQTTQEVVNAVLPSETPDQAMTRLMQTSFDELLEVSPINAAYKGVPIGEDKFDDLSPSGYAQQAKVLRRAITASQAIDSSKLSPKLQLQQRIFERWLQDDLMQVDTYLMHSYPINSMFGWHTVLPATLINMHLIKDEEDIDNYISRLEAFEPTFAGLIETLNRQHKAGYFAPEHVYKLALDASLGFLQGRPLDESDVDHPLWADFNKKIAVLNLEPAKIAAYKLRAEAALKASVRPAYQYLIDTIFTLQKNALEYPGVWQNPNGAEYYQAALTQNNTTSLTPDEIHTLGLLNVEKIHDEMRAIQRKVNFKGSLQDFFKFMREDPRFYYPDTDEGRAQILRDIDGYLADIQPHIKAVFAEAPNAKLQVKPVEAFRERSAGIAFYTAPAKDGSRPGIYYINLFKLEDQPKYQQAALAYHEAIPGHHFERSFAQTRDLPTFMEGSNFTGYTEGYALYAEQLAGELGMYENPYDRFGMLSMRLWRAARLVVDTGIHAKKWSVEETRDYLAKNTPESANTIKKAIERYSVMPGQATSYMIGYLKILELRKRAQDTLGTRFNIKDFHSKLFENGPLPLDELERVIDAWIAKSAS